MYVTPCPLTNTVKSVNINRAPAVQLEKSGGRVKRAPVRAIVQNSTAVPYNETQQYTAHRGDSTIQHIHLQHGSTAVQQYSSAVLVRTAVQHNRRSTAGTVQQYVQLYNLHSATGAVQYNWHSSTTSTVQQYSTTRKVQLMQHSSVHSLLQCKIRTRWRRTVHRFCCSRPCD